MKILWKPAVASFGAGGLLWLADQAISWSINPFVEIALNCVFYAFCYLVCWCILPNGKQTLKQVLQLLKELRNKPKK